MSSAEQFAFLWSEVEARLDWEQLGVLHCYEGGESFFGPQDRESILETGLLFADDLGQRLSRQGTSLYVGASVAELALMLVERFVLEREVLWFEKNTPVLDLIDAALTGIAADHGCALPRPRFQPLHTLPNGVADHVWMVSVLSDPEAFPALHDELYGRHGEGATGRGDLKEELSMAQELIREALRCAQSPAVLSTTDEELSLISPLCRDLGRQLEVPEKARLTAIVGDPVRHCTLGP